jgi:hypothetical protein
VVVQFSGSSGESVGGISLAAIAKSMIMLGKQSITPGALRGGLSGAEYSYSRQDAKNAKGVGRMTENEIGKQVVDVRTTLDSLAPLAPLASWRENLFLLTHKFC